MTGMMPAWFTLSGMYVELPPNILRPTIRRAYCTGIRRWACSMKMTAADDDQADEHHDSRRPTSPGPSGPATWSLGKVATTWVKISSDMPLPMPCSVISSPSHMITALLAVMVTTMTRNVAVPLLCRRSCVQPCSRRPERASATMPVACRTARPRVR